MNLNTEHHIAGRLIAGDGNTFRANDARTGQPIDPAFPEATSAIIDEACCAAAHDQRAYRSMSLNERAGLLEGIATEIDNSVDAFAALTPRETGLGEARVRGEVARTTGQLRLFAEVVRAGDFLGARIDTANPNRTPAPKPDVRQYFTSLGPVAIFGSSNFPLAFSVAGGDTASALAAGCPVVVKAHPAHPGTSALTAAAIDRAVSACNAPRGVFNMVYGRTNAVGEALITHPNIHAVGFTGSLAGGVALTKLAATRPVPIPVYAEMGSVNPLFILPNALARRADDIADGLVQSMTQGCGQFCTNPGLVFAASGEALERFISAVATRVKATPAWVMLHCGILAAFENGVAKLSQTPGVALVAVGAKESGCAQTHVFRTTVDVLKQHPHVRDEVFGPVSIVVEASNPSQFAEIAESLPGQLSADIFEHGGEVANYSSLVTVLEDRAGRVLFNGFPTGVDVTQAMVHGGPFPATSDGRSTSVGTRAIERFLRPVCYQNCPDSALPLALQNANPMGLRRLVDGKWTTAPIT